MKFLFTAVVAACCLNIASAQLISGSVIVDEINYHNDSTTSSGDWFELYNTAASSVDLGNWSVRDNTSSNQFAIPSGTTIGGHQFLVLVNDATAFASRYPTVTNYIGEFAYNLSNHSDQIRLFDSNDVLQYSVTYYGDTLGWPKGAYGHGRTLELVNATANPNDATSWYDGCMFGSPGSAGSACNPPIVFSEINYNSDSLHNSGDWIELHNTTNASIVVTGWKLRDSQDSVQFVFPTLALPADAYVVAFQDLAQFNAVHPGVSNKVGPLPFGASKKGEVLRLYNAANKLQFSVVYDNALPWDTTANGYGYTLNLIDPHGHMDDGNNWKADCFLGSPGVASCVNSVGNVHALNGVLVFPSDDFTTYTIEINSALLAYNVYDIQGKQINAGTFHNGTNALNLQSLTSGVYVLKVNDANATAAYKLLR